MPRGTHSAERIALCVPTICDWCKDVFTPSIKQAGNWIWSKKLKQGKFCSQSCASKFSRRHCGVAGRIAAVAIISGVEITAPHRAKSEQNMLSKFYCIKSPEGFIYTFRNLRHFVRQHPDLFPDGWTIEPPRFPDKPQLVQRGNSRAHNGLKLLFCMSRKGHRESWYGWQGVWIKDRLGNIVWERPP